MKGTDVEIEGTGILHVKDNCQVFSENFLLLSTTSGYTNFTLTPGKVVIPELPNLLTEEETQVLESHQDQADGTLGALDALMTRSPTAGQQREISLRDLLTEIQHSQSERHHYHWLIAVITLILVILILCLTSKYWRPPLIEFASWYALRRTRTPVRAPVPETRHARTCALSMADEDCEMEVRAIMGDTKGTRGERTTGPQTSSMEPTEPTKEPTGDMGADRGETLPKSPGVRYSQPGRYRT
jgi:hypothetical protein